MSIFNLLLQSDQTEQQPRQVQSENMTQQRASQVGCCHDAGVWCVLAASHTQSCTTGTPTAQERIRKGSLIKMDRQKVMLTGGGKQKRAEKTGY